MEFTLFYLDKQGVLEETLEHRPDVMYMLLLGLGEDQDVIEVDKGLGLGLQAVLLQFAGRRDEEHRVSVLNSDVVQASVVSAGSQSLIFLLHEEEG